MYPYEVRYHHPIEPLAILGETDFRGRHVRFGLLPGDRLRHLYILGKTGAGKSTLLSSLIEGDLREGRGCAVLDPHGSLIHDALTRVPPRRTNDVLLLDPSDIEFPISWNPLRRGKRHHASPPLLASSLISVLKSQWRDSWGPRLEHTLRMGLLAVAPHPRGSLTLLYRFFVDSELRGRIVEKSADSVVRAYWMREFPLYPKSLQAEAISPIMNKLGSYLASPILRNILGSERSRIDLGEIMDRRGVILADLSVGRMGEDASALLGSLLLASLQLAGMERDPGAPPFIIYIDEFQRFVNDSLSSLLSESRKYGVGLVLAHQHLHQLPESISAAVLGNAGSMVAFRVGAEDAEVLAPTFAPALAADDLTNLGAHQVAVRLLARGMQLPSFTARTLPPPSRDPRSESRSIRLASRSRYAQAREKVEAHLRNLLS